LLKQLVIFLKTPTTHAVHFSINELFWAWGLLSPDWSMALYKKDKTVKISHVTARSRAPMDTVPMWYVRPQQRALIAPIFVDSPLRFAKYQPHVIAIRAKIVRWWMNAMCQKRMKR